MRNYCPKPGSKYYVPRQKYRTVVAFCLSYNELKDELDDLDGRHSKKQDGMPRGSDVSDPTANEAEARIRVERKIRLIEDTVMLCSGMKLYPYMMESVTNEYCTYKELENAGIPISRKAWSNRRRIIYYKLSKRI